MTSELHKIPLEKWCQLRDLYSEFRKNPVSYNALQTFIEWKKKEPQFPIEIFSLNKEWENDGSFLAVMNNQQVFINTLSDDPSNLMIALKSLYASKSFLMAVVPNRLIPSIRQLVLDMGYAEDKFHPDGTFWVHLPKQEALKFQISPPENVTTKSLQECHAEQINSIWPHRSETSIGFIKTLIRLNRNVGFFEGEKLIAWCLTLPIGSLGVLQVEEAYKRKGLGSMIVQYMSKLLAENDVEVTAPIIFKNIASRSMFEKLGFKIIDKVYWVESPETL